MRDTIEHWRRADRIVREALELSGTSRAGFVAEACGDDRELRDLVERLLREGERTGGALRTGAALNRALGEQDAERLLAEAGALLEPGSRIGHYEIEERIGAGGMGVLYRASDVRLNRPVAIKALSPRLVADATALTRFRREAEILATVSNPGIAAVYSLEEYEGASYLVMELVAGTTLAERLERGALSLERALDLARQMAGALELPHGRGVVHRDLKPGNVMLDDDGNVKLVDFGLAQLVPGLGDGGDRSAPATRVQRLTSSGMLVGTAPYMSPEQVRGARTDQRTDVWAFGCVLYEMIGGVSPFRRKVPVDTLTAILLQDPDWARLPAATPASLRRLLRRCLEKDPERRLRYLGDARLELDQAAEELATGASPPDAAVVTASPTAATGVAALLGSKRALAGAALALAAVAALAVSGWLRSPSPDPPVHLEIVAPPGVGIAPWGGLAISRDGSMVAFSGRDATSTRLYVRRLDRAEDAVPVSGTDDAQCPFFSPDGRWLAYFAEGELRKTELGGRSSSLVARVAGPPVGCVWGPDDTIYFGVGYRAPLFSVHSAGGEVTTVTEVGGDRDQISHRAPAVLPGGQLLSGAELLGGGDAVVLHAPGEEPRTIVDGEFPLWVDGYLIFNREDPTPAGLTGTALMGVAFDTGRLESIGRPVAVLEGVAAAFAGMPVYDVAANGTLVYVPAFRRETTLVHVDGDGRETVLTEESGDFRSPTWSPDGTKLAVARKTGRGADVWVYDILAGRSYPLVSDADFPVWSADGERIYYTNHDGIHAIAATGGSPELVYASGHFVLARDFTPEGLLFTQVNPGTDGDLYLLGEDGQRRTVIDEEHTQWTGSLSPDSQWLAMAVLGATTGVDVYLTPFPELSPRWRVSSGGGIHPSWHPGGEKLYYETEQEVVAVRVGTGAGAPSLDPPRTVYRQPRPEPLPRLDRLYAVHPDGESLAVVRVDTPPLARLRVVLNWTEELKRLVPSGR